MKYTHGVIFLAVGIALVSISALLEQTQHPTWSRILLNLGLVSIAVVLVEHLWRAAGGHPIEHQVSSLSNQVTRLSETVDIVDSSKQVGLDHVHDCLANFGTQADWESLLRSAESRVDLMGRTLFGWTRSVDLDELVLKKIQNESVKFRWLIMSPKNKYLPLLTEEDLNIGSILESKLGEVRKRLTKLRNQLPEELRMCLQVREFDHVPLYCAVVRVDESCFVTPYLFSASSDGSPLLSLKGSNSAWASKYLKEFDLIWNTASEIFATEPEMKD